MNILWTIIMLCSIAAMVVIKPDGAVKAMTEAPTTPSRLQ